VATITELKTTPHTRIENHIIEEYTPQIGLAGLGVLVIIKSHVNQKTGRCDPSYKTIAKKAGVDRSTIIRYVKKLKALNLLDPQLRFKEDGGHATNQYNFSPAAENPIPKTPVTSIREDTLDKGSGTDAPPVAQPCEHPGGRAATTPSAALPPEQSSLLNKKERTSSLLTSLPTEKQKTCPHPAPAIVYLSDDITICHHCYGLLDENLMLTTEGKISVENGEAEHRAWPECEPSGEPEGKHPPEAGRESAAA
jgi:Helix-turn-helix domain